jgi:type I restriction enzyme, S subunit
VLPPTGVTPEVLMTFLRLPVICELMDLYASASMYPAISEGDILGLPVPVVTGEVADTVTAAVQSAFAARARFRTLLSSAKRAVEIAIEDGEAAALAFLAD